MRVLLHGIPSVRRSARDVYTACLLTDRRNGTAVRSKTVYVYLHSVAFDGRASFRCPESRLLRIMSRIVFTDHYVYGHVPETAHLLRTRPPLHISLRRYLTPRPRRPVRRPRVTIGHATPGRSRANTSGCSHRLSFTIHRPLIGTGTISRRTIYSFMSNLT